MQVIELHHPFDETLIAKQPIVLAMGFFDGVHRGHQEVIQTARQEASKRGVPLAAMTFNVSPQFMFQQQHPQALTYLSSVDEKKALMAHFGVDILYVVQLTSYLAALSPQAFVDMYMVGLHALTVVAGFDYTYGDKASANMTTLPEYAQGRFEIIEIPKCSIDGQKVGTTEIKRLLVEDGDIANANIQLGYPYFLSGYVIHGEKRGRELGFPTANLLVDSASVIPKVGVYAVECVINHQVVYGMASIGYNITFGSNRKKTIEINLFDYNDVIYGEKMTVYWHTYLRPEIKFDSVAELVVQMETDKVNSQEYFEENNSYK